MMNLNRANWHHLLDLTPDSIVLDVGAGMGTNSEALALVYRQVVAMEPVAERVEFMRHRFQQDGLTNVRIIRASLSTIPCRTGTFDLALLNGVLEWVPTGGTAAPRSMQKAALVRIHELLRPGGQIYIGIENRIDATYFAGYPDPHCGLQYVTVLPRRLATIYANWHGQPGYRNYLYSSAGYRKLLKEAGFAEIENYLALPDYNHPRFFVPMRTNVFNYYYENYGHRPLSNRLKKIAQATLQHIGLLKYLQHSFAIVARKT